jgi:hypothetical protein
MSTQSINLINRQVSLRIHGLSGMLSVGVLKLINLISKDYSTLVALVNNLTIRLGRYFEL